MNEVLVNKLVPWCAWLLSGTQEKFRNYEIMTNSTDDFPYFDLQV